MSYDASKHQVFSDRVKAAMKSCHDVINREMETLDDIYINETTSGAHADFGDTNNGTKQEHIDAIVAMRAMQTTLAAELSNFTPWLQ